MLRVKRMIDCIYILISIHKTKKIQFSSLNNQINRKDFLIARVLKDFFHDLMMILLKTWLIDNFLANQKLAGERNIPTVYELQHLGRDKFSSVHASTILDVYWLGIKGNEKRTQESMWWCYFMA